MSNQNPTVLKDFPSLDEIETPEEHMDVMMSSFESAWREKYRKGQAEHGGKLWRKSTFAFLVEETLDFVSYVGVLAPQLKRVEELLAESLLPASSPIYYQDRVQRALNILRVGNEEGAPEEEK